LPIGSGRRASDHAGRAVYTTTIFLSALLLFAVQPMLTKMVLPTLGGSPSVWAVSLCFFQGALLLGYCYAFLLHRLASVRSMVVLHVVVLAASCLALPVALPGNTTSYFAGGSYLWLVVMLAMAVGVPFVGMAANAPLLQSWFASTAHRDADEPYFLYRASNAGSLVALIGYPLLFEPFLALSTQTTAWSIGFVFLMLMIALCGGLLVGGRRRPTSIQSNGSEPQQSNAVPVHWEQRLRWMGLAFVPSGLLVAFTTYLSTDIASAPFLWVVPLAIYLVTFIVVFRASRLRGEGFLVTVQPLVIALAILSQSGPGPAVGGLAVNSAIALAAFVTACLICHRRLYLQRPAAAHLTEFYLWMSLGGVFGGIFAAIVAPQIFSTPIEYPLLLALSLAWRLQAAKPSTRQLACLAFALSVVLAVALGAALACGGDLAYRVGILGLSIVVALGVGTLATPALLGVQLTLVTLITALVTTTVVQPAVVYSGRSFFGVHRVIETGDFRLLFHGTTIHGAQRLRTPEGLTLDPTKPPLPSTYYDPTSTHALGLELMRMAFQENSRPASVGIVGLGVGAMACHALPGERWRFFDIDPLVVATAKNPRLFNYLSSCLDRADIVMGDARITLAQQARGFFDYLLIDAFTSDAVPVHLLTVEALQMYLEKLSDRGVLVLHISNRHLELASVVAANISAISGLWALHFARKRTVGQLNFDVVPAEVVLVARHREVLAPARNRPDALPLISTGTSPWTDDFSNIASALVRQYFTGGGWGKERTAQ
jgi:hypothetical protein